MLRFAHDFQIAAGELDAHLQAIAAAIHARIDLLETINSAKSLAMLNIGDRVRFNHHTRPQYLRGLLSILKGNYPTTPDS